VGEVVVEKLVGVKQKACEMTFSIVAKNTEWQRQQKTAWQQQQLNTS
jgi:hypothetical protein